MYKFIFFVWFKVQYLYDTKIFEELLHPTHVIDRNEKFPPAFTL